MNIESMQYRHLGDSPVKRLRQDGKDGSQQPDGDGGQYDVMDPGFFVGPFADRLLVSQGQAPFTVGIHASWGQGKSMVMQLLDACLKANISRHARGELSAQGSHASFQGICNHARYGNTIGLCKSMARMLP
ncbi:MAG: hypothetical protein V3R68_08460 [Gammaproteobacteria bacterium]